ncbi:unnamed protein product [Blepharisma stoltei]|uniref:Thioredoxin domain-containing protein n=1 Tax=Blepharisma stoltei TaxID=1481888 RepID=A0AAU9INQ2_9CILI|nr:unnamed protein product [Blepharisma stoltei]
MAYLHVFLSLICLSQAVLYDYSSTSVHILTSQNFDKQVTRRRDKWVSVIHFYKEKDSRSKIQAEEFNHFADEWQGVFIVGVVNCDTHYELCEAQDIREVPAIKVYPPFPAPVGVYEGEVTSKAISAYAAKFIPSYVIELSNENYQTFLEDKPAVPKVLLFTEKSSVPTLYKALSVAFESKMFFGIVRQEDTEAIKKFKIKQFPKILLYKTVDAKTTEYKGEIKYRSIFEWLNVHSETFVHGGTEESSSTKSWIVEALPQLHRLSADDICYKQEVLCGIFFLNSPPNDSLINTAKEVVNIIGKNKDRGVSVKFMWLDLSADKAFADKFEGVGAGNLVFLKYGKRSRFVLHGGDNAEAAIETTINKISGGDGKFINIKGNLPDLSFPKSNK